MEARLRCVLGVAPHSGWAVVVAVAGTATTPQVVLRERIELADAALPGAKQPYHSLQSLPLAAARVRLTEFEASAQALAVAALRSLIERARAAGVEPDAAALLDASGRRGTTLEAILASHALIHLADGDHFRAALAAACESCGLAVTRLARRALEERATVVLHRSPDALARALAALGLGLGAPWGVDQKSAALVAWLLLAA
jgi:hypothetical protein